jgi:hypothetical protein
MAYKKDWVPSPNFTPASQTQAVYGRPRSISGGAGHWWNWPRSGARHAGIVSYMANRARQAAPHAVLSEGWVTEMVRDADTAWCTSNANPYTFAIEIDPRIMFKWGYDNPSAAERALGERIFETLCEYIADKGYHNLPWKPHNVWAPGTQCNPIPYNDVMARAKQIHAEKNAPKNPWKKMDVPRFMRARTDLRVINLSNNQPVGSTIKRGVDIDFRQKKDQNGTTYLRSKYSTDNGLNYGVDIRSLEELPAAKPEWQQNIKDIKPVKLMVLPAAGTNIINLNDLKVIAPLAKGTYVDFVKSTLVKGKKYLISQYSSDHAMPNGILEEHVGVPATPPVQEKPTWLDKWEDIANVTMYTRVDAPLVDLLTGKTIKTIPLGTAVEVGSTTEWLDGKYAISEYSTGRKEPRGILIVHLDDKPIKDPEEPVEPAPDQPDVVPVSTVVAFLNSIVDMIKSFIASLTKK